jgi:PhnB protein
MATNSKPEGYHTVTPYLIGRGTAELIDFLKQSFGAEERQRHLNSDGTIMHAEVQIGDSVVMMGEASDEFKPMPTSIHLYLEDVDAAYKRAVGAGGKSLREPTDQFYGDRSAGRRGCVRQPLVARYALRRRLARRDAAPPGSDGNFPGPIKRQLTTDNRLGLERPSRACR